MFRLFLAALLTLSSMTVFAHEAGDWIVRVGPTLVDPHEDSDVIDVAGITTLPGVDVGDETQLGITGVYMFTDNIGLELLAATPFTHDITVSGLPVRAGETKHLPPTLSLQYYPMDASSAFQPYVGLGLNATIFFDEKADNQLNLALDGIVGLPAGTVDAELALDNSYGLAAQVGFDYMINDRWMINGAVWWADIDTTAEIRTAIATVAFDVEIDPLVYTLSVGYKF